MTASVSGAVVDSARSWPVPGTITSLSRAFPDHGERVTFSVHGGVHGRVDAAKLPTPAARTAIRTSSGRSVRGPGRSSDSIAPPMAVMPAALITL